MKNHTRRPLWVALLAVAAGITACSSSTARYRDASGDIANTLAKQVQKRTDPRLLRVIVYEFKPCADPSRGGASVRPGGHTADEFARQIKHQLVTALARRMVVIEGGVPTAGRDNLPEPVGDEASLPSPYQEAEYLGANAVLVGNYFVDGDRAIFVMARLVDVRTSEILATAEETIARVKQPDRRR